MQQKIALCMQQKTVLCMQQNGQNRQLAKSKMTAPAILTIDNGL